MNSKERQDAFIRAVERKVLFNERWGETKLFGVSNRAMLIEGALQVGAGNLDSWSMAPPGAVLASVIRFPPADEIYFAVVVEKDTAALFQRLQEMKVRGAILKKAKSRAEGETTTVAARKSRGRGEGPWSDSSEVSEDVANGTEEIVSTATTSALNYRDRNNTVGIYLAEDGKLYMRNSGFWDSFPPDRTDLEPAVKVERLLFAVYPPEPSAQRNLLVRDFVGYFVHLVGRDKVEEIQPWPDQLNIPSAMRRLPASIPFANLRTGVEKLGGYFPGDILERYHISLNHLPMKHFVILSGLSGTGKTHLVSLYACAVHGIETAGTKDPFFFMCPVRPDWTDPTGLIGYYDVISGKYIVTPFLEAILVATAHKETPVFVCIDEMNIARAEFYFADILSAMESGQAVHLHSNSVPLDGSNGEQVPSSIFLPSNLFITGTINVDESTQPLSDKILDRANVIDMSFVNIQGFLEKLSREHGELKDAIDACSGLLTELDANLLPHGLGFGYRLVEEVIRYYSFALHSGVLDREKAFDSQIAQKVLVKMRGGESQRDLLGHLTHLLQPYPASSQIVGQLKNQLQEYGSFQYLR